MLCSRLLYVCYVFIRMRIVSCRIVLLRIHHKALCVLRVHSKDTANSLYKKWHCIFKHLLFSSDDTILTLSQNDDAVQSRNCVSHL